MEKSRRHLIVFDMDGVLIDVSRSYRATVRQTATLFLQPAAGADKLPRPLFELGDLATVKQSGGLNNDWDLTHRVLSLLSTKIIGLETTGELDGWQLYERMAKKCDVGPLADYLSSSARPLHGLMQIDSQPRNPVIDQLYRGDVGSGNIIKQIFQEVYLGRTLFEQTYARPCKVSRKAGYIDRETLFPDHRQLASLSRNHLLAIATGRPRAEAAHPLFRFGLSKYFTGVITLDDCLAEEKRRFEKSGTRMPLGKPHPFILDEVAGSVREPVSDRIYVGDMPDDMEAANRSRFGYIGIGMTISAEDKPALRKRLLQAGAVRVVDDFDALRRYLQQIEST
jgi:phosphoglycolate phosphatase-like HAD superfamily hydrolase